MSDHEEWRPAPEMETYEVSSIGRVRRSPAAQPAINTYPGRVLRPDCATGYERVTLRHKGKQHRMLVHRLVARAFLENARAFAHVNHKDGNKMNNRVDNLEWCSPQQNVHHAWKTGLCRGLYGERNGHTKLTDRDVQVIMSARERGVHLHVIAQVYGVSEAAISCVVTGKTHNHPTNTPHART